MTATTTVRANLALQGGLQLQEAADFPGNAKAGATCFLGGVLYVRGDVGGRLAWFPVNAPQRRYVHAQGASGRVWEVNHGLSGDSVAVLAYDPDGNVLPATVVNSGGMASVDVGSPRTGYAVAFGLAFATPDQGAKADSAVQPGDLADYATSQNASLEKYISLNDFDDGPSARSGFRTYVRDGVWHFNGDTNAPGDIGIAIGGNAVWHAGNDGKGSGLDADLLDGKHASEFSSAGHKHAASEITGLGDAATMSAASIRSGTTKQDVGLPNVKDVSFNWNWGTTPTHFWGSEGSSTDQYVYAPEAVKAGLGLSKVRNVASYSREEADSNFSRADHNHDGHHAKKAEFEEALVRLTEAFNRGADDVANTVIND
ncbi:hypothetical protein [Vreelandella alkaliphila]|uniref:Uncharacterized protein n=1 Tax=Vreelandella alkaliphila TaxID=272774 RepID=A0AAJ2S4B4_9GAMM|nr:hypothetical protein [Halomonas alkaliphila]MDX5979636.1 hypothetical protein [Halomonas alkaliphila]